MSNKNTFVISSEHSRIIHYRKTSPPECKAKSSIIERYTYKSDNGDLLPGTSFEPTTKCITPKRNTIHKYAMLEDNRNKTCSLIKPLSLGIRSNLRVETNKLLARNKTSSFNNRSSNRNQVRTEHCDSTTDIDGISKSKKIRSTKQDDSDSDEVSEYESTKYKAIGPKTKTKIPENDGSDSDCQIIDIKSLSPSKKRKKVLDQAAWVIIADKKSNNDVIEVISDSESDHHDLQSNTLTSSIQKTKDNITKIIEATTYMSEDSEDKLEDNLEPPIYEISDGIKIQLPPDNRSKRNDLFLTERTSKGKSQIQVSPKLIVIQNEPINKQKSYESDDNPDVSSSEMHLRDQVTTPTFDKQSLDLKTVDTTPTNNKSPKYDQTLSPESMKTEFYSYLKINTNPLALKTETIAQNRRSVRVKKLIEQNEKLKEKIKSKKVEDKIEEKGNDIRTKFLKYSIPNTTFPKFNYECNEIEHFDDYIVNYFKKENINYKNKDIKKKCVKKKLLINNFNKKSTNYDRKLLYKKIIIQQKTTRSHTKNKENILGKKLIFKPKINLRKLNNSRIILRNRRVTRQSLRKPNEKNLHNKFKLKIKLKNKKKIKILKKEKPEEKPKLNAQDKLDLLTKTFMEQYATNGNEYSKNDKMHSNDFREISEEINSDSEIIEITPRRQSPVENFLGFSPDDNIHKIRKNMKSALSNITVNPIEKPQEMPSDDKIIAENTSSHFSNSETSEMSREYDEIIINDFETKDNCVSPEIFNSETIKTNKVQNYIPLNPNITKKSFHHSLLLTPKRKSSENVSKDPLYTINSIFSLSDSEEDTSKKVEHHKKIKSTHEIDIQKQNGPVFNTYYINSTLIIVQELVISFWKQTPLGSVLGAQNMWYPIGNIKRLTLERGCINRRSSEMVLTVDSSVAYIELWTKEHQSDYRERPITDVFATVYFHKGQGIPEKKVFQLENIKGYGNDVRFAVMKNTREIVVSWFETFSTPAKAVIRSYQLATDFQSISSTKEMESVEHFILSLHNIGNCDSLVLGAGNQQISVWNLSHGWLSTTVSFETTSLQIHSMCLWALCETGYLFLIQQIGRGILRLVAINGVSSQWKQLQMFHVPDCYESLLGVTVESGILMTCYTNGFLCYDMQSGDLLADSETPINRIILPSEKFLVSLDDYKVSVKHVMVYILEN